MTTPNSRGWYRESPIHRLRFAKPEPSSHWSFNERLRTRAKKPHVAETPEAVLARAMRTLAALGR